MKSKIVAVIGATLFGVVMLSGTAQARPVDDPPVYAGPHYGSKQLCKVHVSWPMSIWQGDYKWVLCSSIKG